MSYELSNQEKIDIVNQHIKNLSFSKYGINLSLIEEKSLTPTDDTKISFLEARENEIDIKIAALQAELETLTE